MTKPRPDGPLRAVRPSLPPKSIFCPTSSGARDPGRPSLLVRPRWSFWTLALLLASVLTTVPGVADEVHLSNGDRLSGTVRRMTAGRLVIETSYAGEISIEWQAVARLVTDQPAMVVLADGTSLRGALSSPEDGRLRVAVDELARPATFDLARVEAVNPPAEPSVRLSGGLQLSLISTRGNTENDNLALQGELVARTPSSRYTLGALLNEAQEDGRDTASKSTAYLAYDHFLTERWYFNSNARFNEDEFRDLNLRTSLGLALGRQFWERDRSTLSLELGLSAVNEDFLVAEDESFTAGHWVLEARQPLAAAVSFFHRQDGLVSLESSEDVVVQTQTGLRFSLFRSFVAAAQVTLDWDNSPSPGREKRDTTYLLTLGYEW